MLKAAPTNTYAEQDDKKSESTRICLCNFINRIFVVLVNTMIVKRIPSASGEGGGTIDLMNIATGGRESSAATGSGAGGGGGGDISVAGSGDAYSQAGMKSLFAQVSFVFMLISGYYAMVLTNWATLQANDKIDDPRTGRAAMWIQATGQWIAVGIYLWSLIAPKIFPNRDFGPS